MTTPEPTFTADQYEMYMTALTELCRPLQMIPAQQLLDLVNRMDTIAPITHATKYHDGGMENLRDQAQLLRAVVGLQKTMAEILERRS